MSKRHQLEKLLQHPRVWRAGQGATLRHRTVPTGWVDLDPALGGGWPVGTLTELLVDSSGIGELRLLLPALCREESQPAEVMAQAIDQSGWVMLVGPPYIPYAPAFARYGVDMSRLLVVHCRRQTEVLWAAEQALRSGTCHAVWVWSERADERALRRLQLAAEEAASCWLVLFRPSRCRRERSPAALRIHLRPATSTALELNIFKYQGGRPRSVVIDLGSGSCAPCGDG